MAFDNVSDSASALPPADYLPALERQRELEAQLQRQQVSEVLNNVFNHSSSV
jgi:hypothetical protein